MNKTLRISFALRNTYRVNSILFSLKQMPIIKELLPSSLYSSRGLKAFANVLSVLWEVASAFIGKLMYMILMVYGAGLLYEGLPQPGLFLHILLLLTIIGSFANTSLFNPTKAMYYAISLMRMDARQYTLINYAYYLIKVVAGFMPFAIALGAEVGLPVWQGALLPFCIAGMKLFVAAFTLWDYEKRGHGYNENKLNKYEWSLIGVMLVLAYGLPALGIVLPAAVSMALLMICIPLGILGAVKVIRFSDYRALVRELLSGMTFQMDSASAAQIAKQTSEKRISADTSITSRRSGFEYLNDLFIKRHKKILWNSSKKISYVCALLTMGVLLALYLRPELKPMINDMVMTWLPYFVFIMYCLNRGTGFTQALFMNCDHSLLTYSFYKRPKFILRLFQIRLREIVKINAVPALVIGVGLALILFASGGTDAPLDYVVLIVSILCMSMFFSIHYLTVYYLLQPYNAGTELKSGTYKVIMAVTYLVCFYMMQLRMPILIFGAMTIAFCVLYGIVASILVYRFAPNTFRIRT